MAYRLVHGLYLGSSFAGKTLGYQLRDDANATAAGLTVVGTYEIGTDGHYQAVLEIPDGHRGWVVVLDGATPITSLTINPEEVVNPALVAQIAEAVLTLDWTTIVSAPARCALQALRHIRNKWAVVGVTKTVYEEDDTTPAWTSTVTADAAGLPITGDEPN